jgi:hypothetical protein
MARLRPRLLREATFLGLGVLLAVGCTPSTRAQGFTPDPFNGVGEYNIGYRDYLTPTYPNGFGVVPNQGVLSGGPRANLYQKYLDEFEGLERLPAEIDVSRNRPGSSSGVPYYRPNRRSELPSTRPAAPNPFETADRAYVRDRQIRDQKYMDYLRQPDPTKRAQLYREYTQEKLRAARDLANPRSGLAQAAPGSTIPASPAATRAVPARPATPNRSANAPPTPRTVVPAPGNSAGTQPRDRGAATSPYSGRRTPAGTPLPSAYLGREPGTEPAQAPAASTRRLSPSEILRQNELRNRMNREGAPSPPSSR